MPSPNDLKPFPTSISLDFNFHTTCVRSISISQCGRYLASGDEDHNVIIWDIRTSKILFKYKTENKVIDCVEWSPNKTHCLLAVTNEENMLIYHPKLYSRKQSKETSDFLASIGKQYGIDAKANDQKEKYAKWIFQNDSYGSLMIKIEFKHAQSL